MAVAYPPIAALVVLLLFYSLSALRADSLISRFASQSCMPSKSQHHGHFKQSLTPVILVRVQMSSTTKTLLTIKTSVQIHPHPFHIIGWAIFFGPIIILIPCLLLLELLILVLFNLSFVSHGIAAGTFDSCIYLLCSLDDSKGPPRYLLSFNTRSRR